MSVVSMIVGAPTPDGATFVAKVDGGGPVRVAVADNASMTGPVFTGSQAVDVQGVAKVAITGLPSNQRFHWQVEDGGVLDTSLTGQFLTLPPAGLPASFTIGIAGDAGLSPVTPGVGTVLAADRLSNHAVFDTIRQRALAENWPMFWYHGDRGYYDLGSGSHGIVGGTSLANYRALHDDNLTQPRQHQLAREVAWGYLWDDHDFGPNNSDGTHFGKDNAAQAYRERIGHYPLPEATGPIYHPFNIGRVLYLAADVRYDRTPNSDPDGPAKTMLGAGQKAWMEQVLAASDAEFLVWLMPHQWMGTSDDSWAVFQTEQAELVQLFGDTGWLGRMCTVGADAHLVAIDTGANSPGKIPVLQAAGLDATLLGSIDQYNLGGQQGRNQYGTVAITDIGSSIAVRLTGWQGTTQIVTHQFGLIVGATAPATTGALLRTLTGSHTPVLEARVVTGHPTGDDPDGTEIKILSGDVTYDGTAEIRASLRLETLGINETTGRSTFPRMVSDLLAPLGAEVFIRYGLDLGGAGILWTPLGYFRVEEDDQADGPFGGIVLAGQDRMAGLVEANLLSPRSYAEDQTLGFIAEDLVTDIYPNAVIAWDDNSDQTQLGRVLVVEESRSEALRDVATAAGKIMYWDDEGALRFESAPDESVPLWEVRSGRDGVMLSASRRVTRRGINNAIILTGQGADDQSAVRATAFDNNPQSPTYFFGQFGQVPREHETPLVTNQDQANTAAIAMLRRSLGAPYQVEFTSIVNPTLRPWQPVRATYRDGNRDVVVMQRVTVPLLRQPMTGTARTSILASIGSLGSLA